MSYQMISAAHVVLDPHPVSGSISHSLQALSLGVPIVTLPSDCLGGRHVLCMYEILQYGFGNETAPISDDMQRERREGKKEGVKRQRESGVRVSVPAPLVVSTHAEYVTAALSIALNPTLRMQHAREILARLHLLLGSERRAKEAGEDWMRFIHMAVGHRDRRDKRPDPLTLTPMFHYMRHISTTPLIG